MYKNNNSEIILIAAVAKDLTISKNGVIPWYIPDDFKRFKNLTMGNPVIMGRSTFESLPKGPLTGRINTILTENNAYKKIVTSKFPDFFRKNFIFNSLEDSINYFKNYEKIFVIGGAKVYSEAIKYADTLDLTIVKSDNYCNGDKFFPNIDFSVWKNVYSKDFEDYSFNTYKRS